MTPLASLTAAAEPFIDIPFNLWLTAILSLVSVSYLRAPRLLLLVVAAASTAIALFDKASSTSHKIKVMCELPLGLGSVLAFQLMNPSFKTRHLGAFTTYVNLAVYGNIAMMVATPSGGTRRGLCCKAACLALSAWIVQQGRRVSWRTVRLRGHLFIFTAVSRAWIFSHAVYRLVLLTLPTFGAGRRHRLLEAYSLGLTLALSRATGLPFAHCFGMADTLAVPVAAGWSAIATTFDLIPRDVGRDEQFLQRYIGDEGDVVLSGVVLAVAVYASYKVARG